MDIDRGSTLVCGQGLKDFLSYYVNVHAILSLLVCVLGAVGNVLNIAVLTRPVMRSPCNAILTGLAVVDLLNLVLYIPYVCYKHLPQFVHSPARERFTYGWAVFLSLDQYLAGVTTMILTWLILTLAVWHYNTFEHPHDNRSCWSTKRALSVIVSAFIICPLVCIPLSLEINIVSREHMLNDEGEYDDNGIHKTTLYYTDVTDNNHLIVFNTWVFRTYLEIIPCIVLAVICTMLEWRRRGNNNSNTHVLMDNDEDIAGTSRRQTDPPTAMLVTMFLLFILIIFSHGVLNYLSITQGPKFTISCHSALSEVIEMSSVIMASLNVVLYWSLSRQFRISLNAFLRSMLLNCRLPVTAQHISEEDVSIGITTTSTQV